jgi:hypothetical protein
MDNTKELSVVKTQAEKALMKVNDMAIESADSYKEAEDVLIKIKTVGKMIKEKKEAITKPLNDSLKQIRELFKPIETTHEAAEAIIKKKMVEYRNAEDAKAEKEKARITAKVESGYIKPETAIAKMDKVADVKADLKEAGVKTSTRKLPRVRIINPELIPREYLVVDEKKVLDDLKAGKTVAGAEIWYETIIA